MRLLHLASSYPLTDQDGSAPFMGEMLQALARRSHEVKVLVPRVEGLKQGDRGGVWVSGVWSGPNRAQVFGYGRSLSARDNIRASAAMLAPAVLSAFARALRGECARWQPDVVHLHWLVPLGALAPLVPRPTTVVISAHGADARRSQGLLAPLARSSLRRADGLVGASAPILAAVRQLKPMPAPKEAIIPHGAQASLFSSISRSAARASLGIHDDAAVVLAVGRLIPTKGFETLIRAQRLTARATYIFIAGAGPAEARLRDLAVGASVELLGQLSRTALATWFAACDLVVVPSIPTRRDADSGPVVLMEAMASGRPVIATPVGMAPTTVIDGFNGFLIPPADPGALAAAIDKALEVCQSLSTGASETFRRLGGWERVAEQLERLYVELRS